MSQLRKRCTSLEAVAKSAQGETEAARELLATVTRELEAVKRSSRELEARLKPVEKACGDAQTAQEGLRYLHGAKWGWRGLRVISLAGKVGGVLASIVSCSVDTRLCVLCFVL